MKKKIKVFLMVLLGALFIGGTTAVFADTVCNVDCSICESSVAIDSSYIDGNYYAIYCFNGTHHILSYDSPLVALSGNDCHSFVCNLIAVVRNTGDISFYSGGNYPDGFALSDSYSFGYANHDIYDDTGKIFFQKMVVSPIRAVKALPAVILPQIQAIIPIAVCCLALLIGSVVLLPRLRTYLR